VLLLDEPTSALDRESGQVVESMVERLNRESGLTVLTVTHKDPEPGLITPLILRVAEGRIREVTWNKESWK
jgi:ABC-type sulfate/molybdate transport systems ATPase subunit